MPPFIYNLENIELVNADHSTAPRGTGNNRPQAAAGPFPHTTFFVQLGRTTKP